MSPAAARALRDARLHPRIQQNFEYPSEVTLEDVIAACADIGRLSFTRVENWEQSTLNQDYVSCSLRLRSIARRPCITSGETALIAALRALAAGLDVIDIETSLAVDELQDLLKP